MRNFLPPKVENGDICWQPRILLLSKVCLLKRYIEVPDGALLLWQISVKIFHRDDKIVIFKQKITKIDIEIAIRGR